MRTLKLAIATILIIVAHSYSFSSGRKNNEVFSNSKREKSPFRQGYSIFQLEFNPERNSSWKHQPISKKNFSRYEYILTEIEPSQNNHNELSSSIAANITVLKFDDHYQIITELIDKKDHNNNHYLSEKNNTSSYFFDIQYRTLIKKAFSRKLFNFNFNNNIFHPQNCTEYYKRFSIDSPQYQNHLFIKGISIGNLQETNLYDLPSKWQFRLHKDHLNLFIHDFFHDFIYSRQVLSYMPGLLSTVGSIGIGLALYNYKNRILPLIQTQLSNTDPNADANTDTSLSQTKTVETPDLERRAKYNVGGAQNRGNSCFIASCIYPLINTFYPLINQCSTDLNENNFPDKQELSIQELSNSFSSDTIPPINEESWGTKIGPLLDQIINTIPGFSKLEGKNRINLYTYFMTELAKNHDQLSFESMLRARIQRTLPLTDYQEKNAMRGLLSLFEKLKNIKEQELSNDLDAENASKKYNKCFNDFFQYLIENHKLLHLDKVIIPRQHYGVQQHDASELAIAILNQLNKLCPNINWSEFMIQEEQSSSYYENADQLEKNEPAQRSMTTTKDSSGGFFINITNILDIDLTQLIKLNRSNFRYAQSTRIHQSEQENQQDQSNKPEFSVITKAYQNEKLEDTGSIQFPEDQEPGEYLSSAQNYEQNYDKNSENKSIKIAIQEERVTFTHLPPFLIIQPPKVTKWPKTNVLRFQGPNNKEIHYQIKHISIFVGNVNEKSGATDGHWVRYDWDNTSQTWSGFNDSKVTHLAHNKDGPFESVKEIIKDRRFHFFLSEIPVPVVNNNESQNEK